MTKLPVGVGSLHCTLFNLVHVLSMYIVYSFVHVFCFPAQWIDSRGFPSFFKTQSQHIDQMVAGGVLEERGGGEQQGLQGKASGSAISHQVETKSECSLTSKYLTL